MTGRRQEDFPSQRGLRRTRFTWVVSLQHPPFYFLYEIITGSKEGSLRLWKVLEASAKRALSIFLALKSWPPLAESSPAPQYLHHIPIPDNTSITRLLKPVSSWQHLCWPLRQAPPNHPCTQGRTWQHGDTGGAATMGLRTHLCTHLTHVALSQDGKAKTRSVREILSLSEAVSADPGSPRAQGSHSSPVHLRKATGWNGLAVRRGKSAAKL